jgi:cytochrome c556
MQPARSITVALMVASCAFFADTVQAQAGPTKAEQTLKYRKALYQVMAFNFGPLGAMAQGKAPYDAAEFARRAERVAMLAPLLTEAYPADTKGLPNSELKPEMWANRADFDAKLKDLVDRTAALATASKSGDFDRSKAAFFDAANSCKACHDKYKND